MEPHQSRLCSPAPSPTDLERLSPISQILLVGRVDRVRRWRRGRAQDPARAVHAPRPLSRLGHSERMGPSEGMSESEESDEPEDLISE